MLRLIWRSWWRNKERLILLLIGAFIIAAGLSYLLGLSETSKGTVVDTLRKNWEAQYHILVRPEGSRGFTENENLLSPNYLSGLSGGISLDQWDTIKGIDDIDVAAPLAVIGYTSYNVTHTPDKLLSVSSEYIYRSTPTVKESNGYQTNVFNNEPMYFIKNSKSYEEDKFKPISRLSDLSLGGDILLAGIDPKAESELVGLKQAVLENKGSRYFSEDDQVSTSHREADKEVPIPEQQHTTLPILLNNSTYRDRKSVV